MASSIKDQDRYYAGTLDAVSPAHLIAEGSVRRTINCRFIAGAITNAFGFDQLEFNFGERSARAKPYYFGKATYTDILEKGDPQLLAPLTNPAGNFLALVLSGRLLFVDVISGFVNDITPNNSFLPDTSYDYPLSYLGNDAGAQGIGGTLVISNGPNRPIFVDRTGARLSNELNQEMPPFRVGATAGARAFVVSSNNILWASDPEGGAWGLAPLTFKQTLLGSTGFSGDIYDIGSTLDGEYVTGVSRLPKFLGNSATFLAQSLIASTENHKYIIPADSPRETWDERFAVYAGSGDGFSGPQATTIIGTNVVYMATTGRVKTLAQDQQRENSMFETFFDNPLGQYLSDDESSFHFREWYRTLDHSRSTLKFVDSRLYATVYPIETTAIDRFGDSVPTITHRALAVGSLDANTLVGPAAHLVWESFYDWFKPCQMCVLKNRLYVVAKDKYGRNTYLRQNPLKRDNHCSKIFGRAFFAADDQGKKKGLAKGELYFRRLGNCFPISVSYLKDERWITVPEGEWKGNSYRFSLYKGHESTDSWGIPLRVELNHGGCLFELESMRVLGEPLAGW